MKRRVFFSFHYENDVMRVQQIRNMGVLEGNEVVSPNKWEEIKRKGDGAIKRWIDENMEHCSCVLVLVGSDTSSREWVNYEIKKAWVNRKGLLGIFIHNIRDPISGTCRQGSNPFQGFTYGNQSLAKIVHCYNPSPQDAYNDIRNNLDNWIEAAIEIRNRYP